MKALSLLLGIVLGALGMYFLWPDNGGPHPMGGTTLQVQTSKDTVIVNVKKDTVIINVQANSLIIGSILSEHCEQVPRPKDCPEPEKTTVPIP